MPKTCTVCGARGVGGTSRCQDHLAPVQTEAERLARQPYRRGYQTAEYRRNRRLCLQFAAGRCSQCRGPLGDDPHVDHIIPLRDGGSDELKNLQATCPRCNYDKKRVDRQRRRCSGRAS